MKKIVSVHWFRHGLRLHDNPALLESLKNADEFYAVFIFDGAVAGILLHRVVAECFLTFICDQNGLFHRLFNEGEVGMYHF